MVSQFRIHAIFCSWIFSSTNSLQKWKKKTKQRELYILLWTFFHIFFGQIRNHANMLNRDNLLLFKSSSQKSEPVSTSGVIATHFMLFLYRLHWESLRIQHWKIIKQLWKRHFRTQICVLPLLLYISFISKQNW